MGNLGHLAKIWNSSVQPNSHIMTRELECCSFLIEHKNKSGPYVWQTRAPAGKNDGDNAEQMAFGEMRLFPFLKKKKEKEKQTPK